MTEQHQGARGTCEKAVAELQSCIAAVKETAAVPSVTSEG